MSFTDWQNLGREHAAAGLPSTPPPLGPIAQQYLAGYAQGSAS